MSRLSETDTAKPLRGRAAAVGLTRAQVVEAAIAQIDAKGLSAFSLRELARSLGVSPAVIYWHVGGSKEDLFAAIAATITGGLAAAQDPQAPWTERLKQVFHAYRAAVHRHPNISPLLGAQMKSNGVANLDWIETVLAALHDGGFEGAALRDAFNALIGGLCGFVTMELAPAPASEDGSWENRISQRMAEVDAEAYPLTQAALPQLANRIFVLRWQNGADVSYDESFAVLLDILIGGIAVRAATLSHKEPAHG
ncbi:TetR/AcrR family transcriptional regulator [Alloyangia pacifica]|uniref:TetR/AcrR family transcriptional regulator n=1 Tax=Alloyangia pacifica TaxID=311180 RepID=UPI001CFE6497|nr:TetR/AcrR family transcriptional regulator [Alloyangia pacifica]